MTESDFAPQLARLQNDDTRAGYRRLVSALKKQEFRLAPITGKVTGIKVRDHFNRYAFSFIVNRNSLLFYLRRPALNIAPAFHGHASKAHPGRVRQNTKLETTITLERDADVERFIAWFEQALPLPEPTTTRPGIKQ